MSREQFESSAKNTEQSAGAIALSKQSWDEISKLQGQNYTQDCVNDQFGSLQLVDTGKGTSGECFDPSSISARPERGSSQPPTDSQEHNFDPRSISWRTGEKSPPDGGKCPQDFEDRFDDRMKNFRDRMYDGIQGKDQITDKEAKRLNEGMVDLQEKYEEFKKDGFSAGEKKELAWDMKMQNLKIFHDRHDNDNQPPGKKIDRYDIEARLKNQHDRTLNGVRNDSLDGDEYERTHRRLTNIEVAYRRLKNDEDGLTDADKEKLAKRLDMSSLQLFHDKHDKDSAQA